TLQGRVFPALHSELQGLTGCGLPSQLTWSYGCVTGAATCSPGSRIYADRHVNHRSFPHESKSTRLPQGAHSTHWNGASHCDPSASDQLRVSLRVISRQRQSDPP